MLNTCPSNCFTAPNSPAISIPDDDKVIVFFKIFFALLARPPISPATGGPTVPKAHKVVTSRRSSDRKRARPASRVEERLDCRGLTQSGLGVLHGFGESPQKVGVWGAKRVEEMETRLTMSAFNLPQFTQIHSRIFFTFTMKPGRPVSLRAREELGRTYPGGTQASPTQYDRNDQDTPTYPLRKSGI